jgi:hypothetical protein
MLPWLVLAASLLLYLVPFWLGSVPSPSRNAFFGYVVIGAIVAARRPTHPVGWLLCAIGAFSMVAGAASAGAEAAATSTRSALPGWLLDPWLMAPGRNLWVASYSALGLLLFVFPNGRLFSRPAAPGLVLAAYTIAVGLVTSSTPAPVMQFPIFDVWFGANVAELLYAFGRSTSGLSSLALFVLGAISMVVRFRRAGGIERQQMKWFAYAGAMLALVFVGTAIAYFSPLRALDPHAQIPPAMFGGIPTLLALIALPVGAAVAIFRYRLYDIDVLINRTLVYGATTAAIAIAFFGGIVLLQAILRPLTSGSEAAVAVSTLASVGLFQPLRARIQAAVDRRFYRSRYDAARTLDAFAEELRDEVDLEAVRVHLLGAVGQTMSPVHASVWLRGAKR